MPTLAGKPITANGLGLMRYTIPLNPVPDSLIFPVLKAALASGANIWNGGEFYGTPKANSLHLMNRYFTAYPEDASKVILCIKSGLVDMKPPRMDCSPEYMRRSVDKCNQILDGKKSIDFFGPARVDSKVPIEKMVEALGELVKEGKIGGIALSEVSADTIRRAAKIHEIAIVEAELSLWSREILQNGVAETCHELGILVLAHTPLGRGMLAGKFKTNEDVENGQLVQILPRYQGENFQQNLKFVEEIEKVARKKGCTTAQLALAWVRELNGRPNMPTIIPIAGARSEERVKENCEEVKLTSEELKEIGVILDRVPVMGHRVSEAAQGLLEY